MGDCFGGGITNSNEPQKQNNQKKKKEFRMRIQPRLAQILFKTCVFYEIKGHIIIKCPHIDIEVTNGFVTHVGQQMLDR